MRGVFCSLFQLCVYFGLGLGLMSQQKFTRGAETFSFNPLHHSLPHQLSSQLTLSNMKLAIVTAALLSSGVVNAFSPSTPSLVVQRGVVTSSFSQTTTTLFGGPDEEEGGLDLDLGEMFDM